MKTANRSILIAGAVKEEVAGIVEKIRNPFSRLMGKKTLISGFLYNLPVQVMVTGPGLLNTVQALTAVIEKKQPAMIIQIGCAGVFRQSGLRIGDIAVASEEIDVQLGIESPGADIPEELPFALMRQGNREIRNRYALHGPLSSKTQSLLATVFQNQDLRIGFGSFITVSTISASDKRAETLYRHFYPLMENMEGAGSAFLGLHYNIPCIEIRAAGNYCGKRERQQWNLPLAFERCETAVLNFLQHPIVFQFLFRKSA